MTILYPQKLKAGDEVRVIAPARSMSVISDQTKSLAIQRLQELGLKVSFGKNVDECDMMSSSSVSSRIEDLHEAFADPKVRGILTVIGGYNSNQLLDCIDYELIRQNPKIFCGFSDIIVLGNALFHKAGLVTYSGPHFSSFGMEKGFEYSLDYFQKIAFNESEIRLDSSKCWADDPWYLDQINRTFYENSGYSVINPGQARGRLIGGSISALQLLQGTPYMPSLSNSILFIESMSVPNDTNSCRFDRVLQSLLQNEDSRTLQAIIIGRFEHDFQMSQEKLNFILASKKVLRDIPIIANADFGHTTPIFTFPIGGVGAISADKSGQVKLNIEEH